MLRKIIAGKPKAQKTDPSQADLGKQGLGNQVQRTLMSVQKNDQGNKETKCIGTYFCSYLCIYYSIGSTWSCLLQLSKRVSFKPRVFRRLEMGQGCPEPVEVLQFPIPKSWGRWDIRKCAGEAKKIVNTAAQQVCRWANYSRDVWQETYTPQKPKYPRTYCNLHTFDCSVKLGSSLPSPPRFL